MIHQTEIPQAKVLNPSMAEFVDFEAFVDSLDKDNTFLEYGIVKVVPPKEWTSRSDNVENALDQVVVSLPIEQNVQGRSGIYELLLIQKKSMKLSEYRKKIQCFDHLTDHKTVEEVEELFWKVISFSPPLYGTDVSGRTLFEAGAPWNLNELPGILRDGLKSEIAGVTNAYLYIGSWKAMFGWHKEDMDLYSINYNHYGKPKFWYCIPLSEAKKLEDFAKNYFGEGFSKCKEFLRHKTTMMHPYLLKQQIPSLKIYKTIQYPGEFIITSGGAYHAGFNWGFNIAEAVNFATVKWMEMLPHADACNCATDSVKIDKNDFFQNILSNPKYEPNDEIQRICTEHGVTKDTETISKPKKKVKEEIVDLSEFLRRSQRKPNTVKPIEEEINVNIKKKHKKGESAKGRAHAKKKVLKERALLEKSQNESSSHILSQSKKIKRLDVIDTQEKAKIRKDKNKPDQINILQDEFETSELEKFGDFENDTSYETEAHTKKLSFEEDSSRKETILEGHFQDILDMQKNFINEGSAQCVTPNMMPDNEFGCETRDTERMEVSQSGINE